MTHLEYDVLVIGGGIAGISLACELAGDARVGLLEMEPTLAFHTTGRSAATWVGTYGNRPVRALTHASHDFLLDPPKAWHAAPLVKPLGVIHVGGPGQAAAVHALHEEVAGLSPHAELVDAAGAVAYNPTLRPDWVEAAVIEPSALEVDVAGLHQGYRRGLRAHGGDIHTRAKVVEADRVGERWRITTAQGATYCAPVVALAAGSWVDEVGALFGAAPVGIEPRRRTVFMVAVDALSTPPPMTICVDTENPFYYKPDAGGLLCSPAEVTLQAPGDAKPDELEIARAIEAINAASTLAIRAIRTSWAGLRNFVVDQTPVIGWDGAVEGLFWYAAQGGFGIQTGPAAARLGAALVRGEAVPADIAATGFEAASVSPQRLAR